ncbi:VOC family protein [Marinigracilibium pacificum]|uniref:VOC family protein n=1 Tax=Marinigracilibium pacificum TaxID=2729599 RepID=A0A848IYJ5_9BACT|nr:VOC family protein [Marinigracilibium pacificum]NMM47314.1 VOC family protein [Marinigracilibium pacificum]
MKQTFSGFCLLVKDYDEAIDFYTNKLDFTLIEDTPISNTKRWVTVSPSTSSGVMLILNKVNNERELSQVGNQSAGKVLFILNTNDVDSDYEIYKSKGISVTQPPTSLPHGKVMIIEDLYGNLIDVIEK